ncbi:MAG: PilZ domain-containing protein [Nitrospirae bacterium]|nr:PilZ domain-containing protein [Nitrospirota bacterium]
MGKTLEYQGYTIQSSPQHLADGEKWQLRIFVSVDNHQGVKAREFSVDVVYATEQEADIHGITFGQRLIDGKVEGQSVIDMKTVDRRATPRLRVQFRTTFSSSTKKEGMGVMLDLSSGGCRVESPVSLEPGLLLELRIYAPDVEWPLMIEAASVQWVSGQTFGLAFFRITETEQQRLGQVIKNLMEGDEEGAGHSV